MRTAGLAAFLAVACSSPAWAKVPYFAATCPTGINVETSRGGAAYINGKRASVRSKNANYSEIVGSGVTISVARDAGSLSVSYTGKGRANGICQVTEQHDEAAATPAAQPAAGSSVPAADKRACLRALKTTTRNARLVVLGTETSEANNSVTIGVGPQRAPWRCLVKRGKVADVTSLTDEGKL